MDATIRNQGASIKALEIQIGKMSKALQERGSGNLPSSTEMNSRDHVKSISTTVETDTTPIRRIRPSRYVISGPQNSKLFFVLIQATIPFPSRLYDDCCDEEEGSYELKDLDAYSIGTTLLDDALPTKEKDLESFTLPCLINNLCFNKALADLGASVSVMDFLTYAKLKLVGIDKFVVLVDYTILDMPEDINTPLILGRPFLSTAHAKIDVFKRKITLRVGPLYEDYIELNDLNEPLELRRNQVDDLEPTIMQDYEHINAGFFPFLSINVMSKSFYNSIVKDKVEYKRRNIVGAFMNVPIFVGNFSVVTDFVVVENIDSYRDEGIGDIIVGRPFCKDACIKARWFDGMITIYKENDSLTYQMASSHPRFKHLTNAQCNKMRPMLKVSAQDELNGISHPYQKLEGF
ncbi:hypothetical protein Tco_1140160 [Tanacetum coccineum]